MITLSFESLKNLSLEDLIESLQGGNESQIESFTSFKTKYDIIRSKGKHDIKELSIFQENFGFLLQNFINIQKAFIVKYKEEKNPIQRSTINSYIEFCSIYINSIQSIYLVQITQQLNTNQFNISIKKSNLSIRLAWVGIFIGAIISWGASAYYYKVSKMDQSNYESQLKRRITLDSLEISKLKYDKKLIEDKFIFLDNELKLKSINNKITK